jgi:carbonic anhydrase
MHRAKPLPDTLAQRYRDWRAGQFEPQREAYRRLVAEGQHPSAMIVACCDSRVMPSSIFGAGPGEFFTHRNIAALVPPCESETGGLHGTSATVEFAVTALGVSHLIVMGHSSCGGVKGCHDMCAGLAPQLADGTSFVGRWMELLRAGYEEVAGIPDEAERLRALEHQAVLTSLSNLMTFPFVAERVERGSLALHGLWTDIAEGRLHGWDPARGSFTPI